MFWLADIPAAAKVRKVDCVKLVPIRRHSLVSSQFFWMISLGDVYYTEMDGFFNFKGLMTVFHSKGHLLLDLIRALAACANCLLLFCTTKQLAGK